VLGGGRQQNKLCSRMCRELQNTVALAAQCRQWKNHIFKFRMLEKEEK